MNRKGFVFTLDAVMAAITAVVMSFIIVNLLSVNTGNFSEREQLSSFGNDILAVLQQEGTLKDYVQQSASTVNSDLQTQMQVFPSQFCGNITLSVYKYQSGFVLEDIFNATKTGCSKVNDIVKVKRIFTNNDKDRYGLAELELWLK